MKMKIAVSVCLMGENCKYNGGNNYSEEVIEFVKAPFHSLSECHQCLQVHGPSIAVPPFPHYRIEAT